MLGVGVGVVETPQRRGDTDWLLPNSVYGLNAERRWAYVGGKIIPYDDEAGRSGRRNSKAWEINAAGELVEFAVDEPRRVDGKDYIRPSQANNVLWPDDFTNAGWSKIGGANTPDAETVNLPAVTEYITQSITASISPGDQRSVGVELKGTPGETVSIRIARLGAGTYEQATVRATLTAEWQRVALTHTFAHAQTGYRMDIIRLSAADTAASFKARRAQANDGGALHAFIPTEGSAGSTAADTLIATQGSGPDALYDFSNVGVPVGHDNTVAETATGFDALIGTGTLRAYVNLTVVVGETIKATFDALPSGVTVFARDGTNGAGTVLASATAGATEISFVAASTDQCLLFDRSTSFSVSNLSIAKVDPFPNFTSSGMGTAGWALIKAYLADNDTDYQQILSIDDGTTANRFSIARHLGTGRRIRLDVWSGGAQQAHNTNLGDAATDEPLIAITWGPGVFRACLDRGTVWEAAPASLPVGLNGFRVGNRSNPADAGSILNGASDIVLTGSGTKTDAELQALVA